MDLRHLQAFVAVAEERHFGRAARRLGITQPPLSRQIQQLESILGVRLFRREARPVELTAEGGSYLAEVRPHLEGLTRAADRARATGRQPQGKVKAGFVSPLGYGLIPRLLEALRAAAPEVSTELFELPSTEQCHAVRAGRLDVGFVFLPVEDQELTRRFLFREPLVAMLPARAPFVGLDEIALERLHHEPFVLCSHQPDAGFRERVVDLCRANGFEPRASHAASSTAAMAALVAANLGVALVPRSAAGQEPAGVIYRPLANAPLTLEIAAVWRPETMSPALRLMLDQAVRVTRGGLAKRQKAASVLRR